MKVQVPCKDCPDRKLKCHGSCERYKEYREYLDNINKAMSADNGIESFLKTQSERRHRHPSRMKRKDYGTNKI